MDRRRDFMAQHTVQHMLSRALVDEARAETVSSRLGASSCTLDVSRPSLTEAEIARAEDVVNATIRDDRVVRAFFPSEEELRTLPLRRAPKVASGIRVGTPAVTTRGMREPEMDLIGELIARALKTPDDAGALEMIRAEVERLCRKFPLYPDPQV